MACTVLWQGTIPDPAGTGTALPFARVGEAIIKAPVEDVANLWWFFNLRKVWTIPWGNRVDAHKGNGRRSPVC